MCWHISDAMIVRLLTWTLSGLQIPMFPFQVRVLLFGSVVKAYILWQNDVTPHCIYCMCAFMYLFCLVRFGCGYLCVCVLCGLEPRFIHVPPSVFLLSPHCYCAAFVSLARPQQIPSYPSVWYLLPHFASASPLLPLLWIFVVVAKSYQEKPNDQKSGTETGFTVFSYFCANGHVAEGGVCLFSLSAC